MNASADSSGAPSAEPSLIEYPCAFPIKVLGVDEPGFEGAVTQLAQTFDAGFDAATIVRRKSAGGRYVGLTITVCAISREQLDNLYRALSAHPMVKWVL